jgi:pilus assembly protein Flp/PilA
LSKKLHDASVRIGGASRYRFLIFSFLFDEAFDSFVRATYLFTCLDAIIDPVDTILIPFSPERGERMLTAIRNFVSREDGPTAVEYAVMLALIIIVCIVSITALGSNQNKTYTTVSNKLSGS